LEGHLPAEGIGQLDDGPGCHCRPVDADPEVTVSSGRGTSGIVPVILKAPCRLVRDGQPSKTAGAVSAYRRRAGRSIWQGVAAGTAGALNRSVPDHPA